MSINTQWPNSIPGNPWTSPDNTNWSTYLTPVTNKTKKALEFKPVKAGTKTAHVVFVLDDSGSMQVVRDQTISGFNEFLQSQRGTDVETYISLYKFDGDRVNNVFKRVHEKHVKDLNYKSYDPCGTTNLNDAIGNVMFEINYDLTETKKKKRDSVTVVILTDGYENASKEFDTNDVKGMVELAEAKDWAFMFLGANIDAFAAGAVYGFGVNNTLQYSTNNMHQTMAVASASVNRMKSARSAGMDVSASYLASAFTDEERNSSNS